MLELSYIRENPQAVEADLKKRRDSEKLKWLSDLLERDKQWRALKREADDLRASRNTFTKRIQEGKTKKEDVKPLIEEAKAIPQKIKDKETLMEQLREKIDYYLMRLPNILHESVPVGAGEQDNPVIREWGVKRKLDFELKHHGQAGVDLDVADFERAVKISGAGFYFLKGDLALLDFALQNLAIRMLVERGFTLIEPPLLMRRKPYEGVTDLADFENVMYRLDGEDLYLIATSEHAMGAMLMGETLNADALPIKLCGVSPCFRKEIGAHGKYTKGLFRVHQFNKVEQFIFCLPEQSWGLHEELQRNSEQLYQGLGLHHRVVNVCTGDIGSIAAKKYDTEVWMADGEFREVGSNSNCTDYQARSLGVRYRLKEGQVPAGFVHTLNNTALATSRTMIAIFEQCQQEDGSIKVPEALLKYMNGIECIEGKLNRLKI